MCNGRYTGSCTDSLAFSLPPTARDSAQDPVCLTSSTNPLTIQLTSSGLASSQPPVRTSKAVPSERADRCEMGSRSDKTLPEMSMDEKMSLFDGYRVVRSRGTRNGG
jgi:hypothetical protein